MKKLAQGFNTAAQDSNPGSLSRESGGLHYHDISIRMQYLVVIINVCLSSVSGILL